MINQKVKFKTTSENTFQKNDDHTKHSPSEWNRHVKRISLSLDKLELIENFNIHNLNHKRGNQDYLDRLELNSYKQKILKGFIIQNNFQHDLYYSVENEDQTFSLALVTGDIHLFIKTKAPADSEESDNSGNSLHEGYASLVDPKSKTTDINLVLYIPEDQINSIISSIQTNPHYKIKLDVYLWAFTNKIDDEFKSFDASWDIVLNNKTYDDIYTPCFLSYVQIIDQTGQIEKIDLNKDISNLILTIIKYQKSFFYSIMILFLTILILVFKG